MIAVAQLVPARCNRELWPPVVSLRRHSGAMNRGTAIGETTDGPRLLERRSRVPRRSPPLYRREFRRGSASQNGADKERLSRPGRPAQMAARALQKGLGRAELARRTWRYGLDAVAEIHFRIRDGRCRHA